jgi:serine/threonine-protein kinase
VTPAAYELYLLASDPRAFRSDSAAREALDRFREAVALDSTFARAYAGLAYMHLRVAPPEHPAMPFRDRLRIAEGLVLQAIGLDSGIAEAHMVLGVIRMRQFRFGEAEASLDYAHRLASSWTLTGESHGYLYQWTGRFEEGLAVAKRTLDADPLSPSAHAELARAYMVNGNCGEARAVLAKIANLRPPVGRAREVTAQCHALEQRWSMALEAIRNPQGRGRSLHAFLLARAGDRDEALATLAVLRESWERTGGSAEEVATLYAGLGDLDQAFLWLNRAVDDFSLTWRIREPLFAELHADPRFTRLLGRLGLQNR